MKITRLELENWMGIPSLQLDFSRGINILYGRNEIGKSSVVEAIRLAILGDAGSKSKEYNLLRPWGTRVKAVVNLHFTDNQGSEYRLEKSFPGGGAALYKQGIKITDEPRKTQEKLYNILDVSDKTANLFKMLFIDQGQSLDIFNTKSKDNPLDDNTKSYIKEVIKETAFKDLQEFKDHLQSQLDVYLTPKNKVKTKSPYKELLDSEKELASELETLRSRETGFLEKLAEIEKADQTISADTAAMAEQERLLAALKTKKDRLLELEKKQLAFLPIKNDYHAHGKHAARLAAIEARLPVLSATRDRRLQELNRQVTAYEAEKEKIARSMERMKAKKREGEALAGLERDFQALQKEYREVESIQARIRAISSDLPHLFALNRAETAARQTALAQTMAARNQKQAELKALKTQLKESPRITAKIIKELKKLENTVARKEAQVADSREQLKLSFRLTPVDGRDIPYTLKTDQGAVQEGSTRQPLGVSGFSKLELGYPGHFHIKMAGSLATIDLDALAAEIETDSGQLTQTLESFGVETIEQLEERAAAVQELKNQRQILQAAVDAFADARTLQMQQQVMVDRMTVLAEDIKKYCGDVELPNLQASSPESAPSVSGQSARDKLTAAKTAIDSLRTRLAQLLAHRQCSAEALANQYKQQDENLKKQRTQYNTLEPQAMPQITQDHLDKEAARLTGTETKRTETLNEIQALKDTPPLPSPPETEENQPLLTGLSSRQLRDDIKQSCTERTQLQEQVKELLGTSTLEVFDMNYFRRKDEIDTLGKELKEVPPVQFSTVTGITAESQKLEAAIKKSIEAKRANESIRDRLIGETADFSHISEEKKEKEYQHRQILNALKGHISTISTLKLLSRFIDEERERAQQEVFKPLQDRVVNSFSTLVGDRYDVRIDNELNLNVSGRALTGEYQDDVGTALSFGTREQLSFLFRLAIASQLSSKETGIMVLDDSFVNTDNQRLPGLLDLLTHRSEDLQFLVFTCRPDDYLDIQSKQANDNFHPINLEEVLEVAKQDETK